MIVDFVYALISGLLLYTHQKEEMWFVHEGWVENLGP